MCLKPRPYGTSIRFRNPSPSTTLTGRMSDTINCVTASVTFLACKLWLPHFFTSGETEPSSDGCLSYAEYSASYSDACLDLRWFFRLVILPPVEIFWSHSLQTALVLSSFPVEPFIRPKCFHTELLLLEGDTIAGAAVLVEAIVSDTRACSRDF